MVTPNIRVITIPDLEGRIDAVLRDFWLLLLQAAVRELQPALRGAIPVRSGRLRDSFFVRKRGQRRIEIGFSEAGFYWLFQRGMRSEHLRIIQTWLAVRAEQILQQAIDANT